MEYGSHDTQLFDRIKSDDRKALNELFGLYYTRLCQFAASHVSEPEAEEIVSDIFFTLWKQRKELTINKSLRAYLYTSVRHACLAVLRKNVPSFQQLDVHENSPALIHYADPHQSLHTEELKNHIELAVGQLPDRCRQIFVMNRYDGLKYREIAEILSLSEKTVENQVIKALQIMRAYLALYEDNIRHPA